MAVRIRLRRMGKKKQPSYRVVIADARAPRDGRFIESIGRYDPLQDPSLVEINNERARYWMGIGAQPTERVKKLFEISGAVARPKVSRAGVYRLDDDPIDEPVGTVETASEQSGTTGDQSEAGTPPEGAEQSAEDIDVMDGES